MAEVVAGIALPEGEPSSALATASGFRAAAGGFETTGGVTQRALGLVGSWQGIASVNFRDRCTGYEQAAASAQTACAAAARAVRVFARDLEEARDRVRRLQREAEECVDRIQAAEARAAAARESEAAARARATSAALSAPLDGGSFSLAEETQALNEADAAAAEAGAAEADAADAREQLERLREQAEHERERVEQAGRRAAGQVQAAAGQLPTVSYPAPPSPPAEGEEEDKSFWEDAWDGFTSAVSEGGEQVLGVGKGIGEGVVGIGEGGLMLYRLSPANALIDPDSFEREWTGVQDAAEFAWSNPGEFGKAVINWEDLAEGRYDEWVGNLGPDVVLAVATAGTGTAATRGLRGADSVGDVADAARDADRVVDAARAAPDGGGGWVTKNESMSDFSRRYQEFNGGRPGEVYRVGRAGEHADFDSIDNGVLVDSKGNYDHLFKDGEPQRWWNPQDMIDQAERQIRVAGGQPIEWRFAENGDAYRYFREELRDTPIRVRHVPMPD